MTHRLQQLLDTKGFTQKDFANEIGINQRYVSKIINGTVGLGTATIEKIALRFPEVNLRWLIGLPNEEMLTTPFSDKNGVNENAKRVHLENEMQVPLVSYRAQAGFASGWGDPEYIEELPTVTFEVDREYSGEYVCFEVAGDSMFDEQNVESLFERDLLLCREVQRVHWKNKLHINQWDFVVVHKTEGVLVKRITEHNVDSGKLLLHSLNPYYKDQEVFMDDLVAIFNVVNVKRNRNRRR